MLVPVSHFRFALALLIVLAVLTLGRLSSALTPPYLGDMPTVVQVQAKIRASDPIDNEVKLSTAFHQLCWIVRSLSAGGEYGNKMTPDETALCAVYGKAADDAATKGSQLLARAGAPRVGPGSWGERSLRYSTESVRQEVLADFARIQEIYNARKQQDRRPAAGQVASAGALAPAPATAPQWVQADIARARDRNVDLAVFGIQLGEPLNLPKCGEADPRVLLAGLTGIARGGAETCIGDAGGETAIAVAQLFVAFSGLRPASDGTDQVSVGLAESKCPMWLKTGGNCVVMARRKNGFVVGVTMAPGVDEDAQRKAPEELARKYGPADPLGRPVQCTAPVRAEGYATDGTLVTAQVGAQTHEATGRSWSKVPGLYVSYSPIAVNCRSGLIEIDLAGYHQSSAVARAQSEASEPKM
jgi:hypothetical protein